MDLNRDVRVVWKDFDRRAKLRKERKERELAEQQQRKFVATVEFMIGGVMLTLTIGFLKWNDCILSDWFGQINL